MRIIAFLLISILFSKYSCAQEFQKKQWKAKKGSIEYLEFCPIESREKMLVCMLEDEAINEEFLKDLAVGEGACLIMLSLNTENNIPLLTEMLSSTPYNELKEKYILVQGENSRYLVEFARLGYSGIIVHPVIVHEKSKIENPEDELVYILIGNDSSTFQVKKTLDSAGVWVFQPSFEELNKPFAKESLGWYYRQFEFIDSMSFALNDSNAKDVLLKKAGIINGIPEIVKQGRKIELSIFVVEQGVYEIKIADLGGKEVFSSTSFFGKGTHKLEVGTKSFEWGVYRLFVSGASMREQHKFMIRG